MSEMGHTFAGSKRMSALPPKADIRVAHRHVCFGQKATSRNYPIVASLVWGRPGPTKKGRQDCVKRDGGPEEYPDKLARQSDVSQIKHYD